MAPIYKMFLGRYTPDWHTLDANEQRQLNTLVRAAFVSVGGELLIDCDASRSNEGWEWFGVERFPDQAALDRYNQQLASINWSRYVLELAIVGTERFPDRDRLPSDT